MKLYNFDCTQLSVDFTPCGLRKQMWTQTLSQIHWQQMQFYAMVTYLSACLQM